MTWQIKIDKKPLEYQFDGEFYHTEDIIYIERKIDDESSSEYKAPNDTVMTDTYRAKSQHGTFEWNVTASLRGFDGHANIDEIILTKCPPDCKLEDELTASIEEDNDLNDSSWDDE